MIKILGVSIFMLIGSHAVAEEQPSQESHVEESSLMTIEQTKQLASDAWRVTKEEANEFSNSETGNAIKNAASEVAETLTDEETYKNAWEKTKEISQDAYDGIKQASESEQAQSIKEGAQSWWQKAKDKAAELTSSDE
jgi:hypothetical protein